MVFEAKCQSFKIFLVMLILVGSSLSGNCQADRNPITLSNKCFHRDLIGPEGTRQLDQVKQDHQRNQKRWSEFKLFASEQASSAKQMLASLEIENWWQELSRRDVSPAVQQRSADGAEAGAISTTATAVNLAASMSSIQWWQASNLAAGLVDSGQRRMAQVTTKLEAELQVSLNQLVELTSSNIGPRFNRLIQAMAVDQSSNLSSVDSSVIESSRAELLVASASADEDSAADPYWQYYADCDFWGAQFEAADE